MHPGEGLMKEETFPHTQKPLTGTVRGKLQNLRGEHSNRCSEGKVEFTTEISAEQHFPAEKCLMCPPW